MRKPAVFISGSSIALAILPLLPSPALAAAERIGLAVIVRNDVSQIEPATSKILKGDDVIRDEVVQTSADSNAKFVLKDSTNLMLGPNSKMKLDRAVFSDQQGVGDIAIKLTLGSFRFITGMSAKESYAITTPLATLGVRGTILDFHLELLKNTVVLKEGASRVCAGGNCVELAKVGDAAVITANGSRINIELQPSSTWSFDSACNGMCSPMSFAQAEDSLTTGSIGGAGGGGGGGGGPTSPSSGPLGSNSGITPALTTSSPGTGGTAQTPLLLGSSGSATAFSVSPH
ncbi:FecR domain-containing protein [Bradyrhizobium sp.]|uniref:FecR family protein n=1 Tax=Bradyrhizobium sp. TaxID=376 RepID=UPI0039E316D3